MSNTFLHFNKTRVLSYFCIHPTLNEAVKLAVLEL